MKELKAESDDCANKGTTKSRKIAPADLAAWCEVKGIRYPLPGGVTLPQTDVGLRDALVACERERAELRARAAARETAEEQRASLQFELNRLRDELRDKAFEVAALTIERDTLKADILAGKAKTTALKIIGGSAMAYYGMNIHAHRLEGIGELIKELQRVGVDMTEKTLREWLKDAADVIDKHDAKP